MFGCHVYDDSGNSSAKKEKAERESLHATNHHLVNDQHYGTSSLASLFSEFEALLEARLTDMGKPHSRRRLTKYIGKRTGLSTSTAEYDKITWRRIAAINTSTRGLRVFGRVLL